MWGCALVDFVSKNPPPAPLLNNLGDTPGRRMDIEDLRNFLMLMFEQLGGGDDNLQGILLEALSASATVHSRLTGLTQRVDTLERQLAATHRPQKRDEDALKLALLK